MSYIILKSLGIIAFIFFIGYVLTHQVKDNTVKGTVQELGLKDNPKIAYNFNGGTYFLSKCDTTFYYRDIPQQGSNDYNINLINLNALCYKDVKIHSIVYAFTLNNVITVGKFTYTDILSDDNPYGSFLVEADGNIYDEAMNLIYVDENIGNALKDKESQQALEQKRQDELKAKQELIKQQIYYNFTNSTEKQLKNNMTANNVPKECQYYYFDSCIGKDNSGICFNGNKYYNIIIQKGKCYSDVELPETLDDKIKEIANSNTKSSGGSN